MSMAGLTTKATIASAPAMTSATTAAQMRGRRMSRRNCRYSSAGICAVFQVRQHFEHVQRSPYGTKFDSPHSHVIEIGRFRTGGL